MATVPSYQQWMKDTNVTFSTRSTALVKVDNAIKKMPVDKEGIKQALDEWKLSKFKEGKRWQDSDRNKSGAITNLNRAVNVQRELTTEEREALSVLRRHQVRAVREQFKGKRFTFKSSAEAMRKRSGAEKLGKYKKQVELAHKAKDLHNKVGGLITPAKPPSAVVQKMLADLCDGLDIDVVLKAVGFGSSAEFITSMVPLIGLAKSGAAVVTAWGSAAAAKYKSYSVGAAAPAIAAGDPAAAFSALLVLLNREVNSKLAKAGTATAGFGIKALGLLDGGAVTGPVGGAFEIGAGLVQDIYEYVRDVREMEAANKLIDQDKLDLDLFNTSPLLGCYFLVVQDHSTIMNMALADYATADFVHDAEKLIDRIRPVLAQARQFILLSRMEIAGFEKAKGIAAEKWEKKGLFDKVTDAKAHIVDIAADKLDAVVFGAQPSAAPVDKERIVGFGKGRERSNAVTGRGT